MAIYSLDPFTPELAPNTWVAPTASVIGQVRLAEWVSIWWGAVLRGDNEPIVIGERSNIQDLSVLHTDIGFPLTVGAGVTVGHQVMLHGCTVEDGALIGIQSIILNGAIIGKQSLVGAGTLVLEGQKLPERSLIVGRPARVVRALTDAEIAKIEGNAEHYIEHLLQYRNAIIPSPLTT